MKTTVITCTMPFPGFRINKVVPMLPCLCHSIIPKRMKSASATTQYCRFITTVKIQKQATVLSTHFLAVTPESAINEINTSLLSGGPATVQVLITKCSSPFIIRDRIRTVKALTYSRGILKVIGLAADKLFSLFISVRIKVMTPLP